MIFAQIVARYLTHLPYEAAELRMIPRKLFEDASVLFEAVASDKSHPF